MITKPKATFDIRRTADNWLISIEYGTLVICFSSVKPFEEVRKEAHQQLQRELLAAAT